MTEEKKILISSKSVYIFTILTIIPTLLILYLPYFIIWEYPNESLLPQRVFGDRNIVIILMTFLVFIFGLVIHELIHGFFWSFFTERKMKSIKFGLMWNVLMPYCSFLGPLSRQHFLIGTLAPLIIMGILPSFFALLTGNDYLELFGITFTIAASGDIFIAFKIIKKKKNSLIVDSSDQLGLTIINRVNN